MGLSCIFINYETRGELFMKLKGVYIVMATPFKADESVDFDAVKHNIEKYIAAGVHGVMVAGALGEYLTMTFAERKELVEFAAKVINGRIPFIVGTTAHRTQDVIDLTNHAGENKAAGVMILPPPGTGLMSEEIYSFFKTVCENVSTPIMLYNNPGSSGLDMDTDFIESLAKLPNLAAVKESSGDIKRITRLTTTCPHLSIFCGWEDMHYECFLAGAVGWVCMGANFAPGLTKDLLELVQKGDIKGARALTEIYNPIAHHLEWAGKVSATTKYIMGKCGFMGGLVRSPRTPLTEAECAAADAIIKGVKLY